MKTFGILALGGAMGIQFEDLNYTNLREAYLQVFSLIHPLPMPEPGPEDLLFWLLVRPPSTIHFWLDRPLFRRFQKFMETKISIPISLATITFHISNGAMLMAMDQLHFLNQLDVDQKQDSGTHHE